MPKERLAHLARKAGLSEQIHLKVIDAWTKDSDIAPSFLRIIEPNHYALGEHFKQAQNFITQGGEKEITMSKAGKRSIEKRKLGYFSKNKSNEK